ncbi:vacuolar sorting protein [Emericellopsis atlantica]|uniref:Vacuolar protein sorting/targeting protein 10 n=1 Tax=Emericellopsis atlantica TaxID=2614577 RepID=A0A9P7ZCQ0_9HYPO|nr:vacuolar sorting protein [Emericellopsis atlantica]KAG9249664.1 vacuolar sorting protein [Emericellopsis atlantica]
MRSGGQSTSWRLLLLAMAVMLWSAVVAAKGKPDITVTKLEVNHMPENLNYFEDSDVILFQDISEGNIYRSDNAGKKWERVGDIPDGHVAILIMHKYDKETAFAISGSTEHYKTNNRGKTWEKFNSISAPSDWQPELLVFHADDPKSIIFNGEDRDGIFSTEQSTYTTDGFETVDILRAYTSGCWWAKSSPEFSTGDADKDKLRTMCIVSDPFSFFQEEQRLHISDSFFAVVDDRIDEFEPAMDTNKLVDGVVNLAVVKGYILVATSSWNSDEMALYVSDDTIRWHRAMFPVDDDHDHSHRISQNAYTVLESTNYSIQVDVMTSHPSQPMGVLFTSNSNGTYFTENVPYTNRNDWGHVDFEKMTGIQGVYLVNVVNNGKAVDEKGDKKNVVSRITFDDGRTFEPLKAGDEDVHLHSETHLNNIGKVFSSLAPGLVMGNGNTGKDLNPDFRKANLFVSDDAGLSWKKALDGPHKYEFGDSGSILLAVKDSEKEDVKEISYSIDHGDSWESVDFPKDTQIRPYILTTTQDSTSLKFLLLGIRDDVPHILAIDFGGMDLRTCKDDDLEEWHARVDDDGKPTCVMGHKQTYKRRKKSAECFIKNDFKDPVPETEDCECTDKDFECDYNFQRDPEDDSKCKKVGPIPRPEDSCKNGHDDTFMGTSGWRLIPGNTCKRGDGKQKDAEEERKCSDAVAAPSKPASGEISSTQHVFDKVELDDFQKIYLERGESSSGTDETIIIRPAEDEGMGRIRIGKEIFLSSDHGKKWKRILEDKDVRGIYPHEHFKDVVFFTTKSDEVLYTIDRGQSFHSFTAPTEPGDSLPLSFHPEKKDWLIWVGKKCEGKNGACSLEASLSLDRGDNWRTILRYVQKCEFTGYKAYRLRDNEQIVCLAHSEENNDAPLTIVMSNNLFKDSKTVFEGEVTNFATMSEFIVLAGENSETKALQAYASLDGEQFEAAHFPYNFNGGQANEYTVLDSSTHAVNLFVLTEGGADRQYGSIVKSNSNGTSYVLSAPKVNCDEAMYVDFEKVAGLEGVVLINTVINADKKGAKTKELQTKISHNDGNEWGYLAPPDLDVDGKVYKCLSDRGDKNCALHLHHYTERDDKRKTFAASTALGLIFGVGNVGNKLGDIKDADTFMSTDGGITWKNVKKGHWTWQYGDQGSIIVLVQRATSKNDYKTDSVSYSTDEGRTWQDYKFADSKVTVLDITTLRTGTSRNFLLWCKSGKGKTFSVNLDFTGLTDRACEATDGNDSDYYTWSPKHPLQDNDCLFGHVAKYLRKKPDSKCYNDQNLKRLLDYENCACSRQDFECAYNYELDNHNQCSLVEGLEPMSQEEWCKQNPNATEWYEPTGYRKVPLSTCQGGAELDKISIAHPCKGHEEEFERKHRTSALGIFLAVVIPFLLAGGIGWWVWKNWNGKFGQIRLGDGSSTTFDSDQPWIKYPVVAISAVAAVAASTPLLIASLFRTARGTYERVGGRGSGGGWFSGGPRRFTTRDSFARGRGDYTMVDDDEGELLGDDSDEEV